MNQQKPEIKIQYSRLILFGVLIFSLFFCLTNYGYIINQNLTTTNIFYFLISIFFEIVILCIFFWSFSNLVIAKPIFFANSEALYTRKSGELKWKEVEKIEISNRGYGSDIPTEYLLIINLVNGNKISVSLGLTKYNRMSEASQLRDLLQQY